MSIHEIKKAFQRVPLIIILKLITLTLSRTIMRIPLAALRPPLSFVLPCWSRGIAK